MAATRSRRTVFLLIGVLVLPGSLASAAEPLSEEESEKLFEEVAEPLPGFQGCVHDFAFSPDGGTLVGVGGPFPTPSRLKSGRKIYKTTGEFVVWPTDTWEFDRQTERLRDRSTRAPSHGFALDPAGQPWHASFVDPGKRLAVVTDQNELRLFRYEARIRNKNKRWIETQSLSLAKPGHGFPFPGPSMQISPDQESLALPVRYQQEMGAVELWKITNTARNANAEPAFAHHQTLKHSGDSPFSNLLIDSGFALGGKVFITAAEDGTIRIWNPETGEVLRKFSFQDELPNDLKKAGNFDDPRDLRRSCRLAVSPDGETLAVTCAGIVRLYDLQANRWTVHHRFVGFMGGSHSIAFHPSGRWLVSISFLSKPNEKGQYLILRSVPRLEPELTMKLPEDMKFHQSFRLTFSPDGKILVNSGYTPHHWDFEKLLKEANVRVRR